MRPALRHSVHFQHGCQKLNNPRCYTDKPVTIMTTTGFSTSGADPQYYAVMSVLPRSAAPSSLLHLPPCRPRSFTQAKSTRPSSHRLPSSKRTSRTRRSYMILCTTSWKSSTYPGKRNHSSVTFTDTRTPTVPDHRKQILSV